LGQLRAGVLLSLALAVLVGTIQNRHEESSIPQTEEKVNQIYLSATSMLTVLIIPSVVVEAVAGGTDFDATERGYSRNANTIFW